ncbi:MAG: M81 family metallopeptidase [Proteobacteria bacterium]|nr:M81 family metallopeptidase [Pseudomonadota bacterium]
MNQETHCLSPLTTTLDDFRRVHFLVGDELAAAASSSGQEVVGLMKNAELSGFVKAAEKRGATTVPLLSAWALPAGPISRQALVELRDGLVAAVRDAGQLDGVFLALHGAMGSHEMDEPEAWITEELRAALPDIPIVTAFDLHGLLTSRLMAACEVPVAYRTNPHRDHPKIGARCAELLADRVEGWTPHVAWRSLPMILGGGSTVDLLNPMRGVFRQLDRMEKRPGVRSVSLFMCHLWNHNPDLGWSTVAVCDTPELAEAIAEEIAEFAWSVRHEQPPEFHTADSAIAEARGARFRRATGCVTMVDASDVVGAGAPGDNTALIRALYERGHGLDTLACVRDAQVATELLDRLGEDVEVEVGARLTHSPGGPLAVRGRVIQGDSNSPFGNRVTLDCGHLKLVVTEQAPLPIKPDFYNSVGLSTWKADVVVVKNFFHYRWYFLAQNRLSLYVKTQGITDFDAVRERVQFTDPVWPFQPVEDWRPADARRRKVET